jgi:hypothetical protein
MARTHRMQWIAGSLALVLAGCMMTGYTCCETDPSGACTLCVKNAASCP